MCPMGATFVMTDAIMINDKNCGLKNQRFKINLLFVSMVMRGTYLKHDIENMSHFRIIKVILISSKYSILRK